MRLEISQLHARLMATMNYVTHDRVKAMTVADKIIVLHGGKVGEVGSAMELYRNPTTPFIAGLIGILTCVWLWRTLTMVFALKLRPG